MSKKLKEKELKEFAKKYSDKVAKLLLIGDRGLILVEQEEINYIEKFGFCEDDVEQLLLLANDEDIYNFDYSDFNDDEGLEFYGVIHAWHVLSQLKVPEAKDIFIKFMEETDEDDIDEWILDSFFKLIKPYRKDMYQYFIDNTKSEDCNEWVRAEYISVLKDMVKTDELNISKFSELVEYILKNSKNEIVISSIISMCVDLKLTQYMPLIKKCFDEDSVDIDYVGDYENIEIQMGLKEVREKPMVISEKRQMFQKIFKNMIEDRNS